MIQGACMVLLMLMVAAPAAAEPSRTSTNTADERRDSGTIVRVAPDGSSIVIEEMGAWTGSGTGLVTRSIRIAPRAPIRLLEYTGRWDDRTSTPGWDSHAVEAASLRPGDFVTVTSEKGRRDEAVALQVVRPSP